MTNQNAYTISFSPMKENRMANHSLVQFIVQKSHTYTIKYFFFFNTFKGKLRFPLTDSLPTDLLKSRGVIPLFPLNVHLT